MLAVSLVHKYSDNYKNKKEWDVIRPGETGEPLTVEFNTGALTTGRDWWVVTWYSPDMKTLYYSAPNNFRGLIDGLEKIAPATIGTAAAEASDAIASESGVIAQAASAALEMAAQATTKKLFNTESTEGFKQHILRSEDQGKMMTISISDKVTFTSKSGVSKTNFKKKSV